MSGRGNGPTFWLLLALALAGCLKVETQAPVSAKPDVILLTVDTLRADHVGVYGYHRTTTPNLDRFAQEAIVFRDVMATSSWTAPSMASIMTGLYPKRHGLNPIPRTNKPHQARMNPEARTIAQELADLGYRTVCISTNPWLSDTPHAFTRGCEEFQRLKGNKAASEVYRRVKAAFDADDGRPLFAWAHVMDPHAPYCGYRDKQDCPPSPREPVSAPNAAERPPPGMPSPERIPGALTVGEHIDAYDRGILRWDAAFGELIEWLREANRYDNSVIAIVSDHGEEFGEHGRWSHGYDLHRETLAVPWIMTAPQFRADPPPLSPSAPLSVTEVKGCILAALGQSADCGKPDDALFAELRPAKPRGEHWYAIRRGPLKLIRSGEKVQLYMIDQWQEKDATEALVAQVGEYAERPSQEVSGLPAHAEEQLRALGY